MRDRRLRPLQVRRGGSLPSSSWCPPRAQLRRASPAGLDHESRNSHVRPLLVEAAWHARSLQVPLRPAASTLINPRASEDERMVRPVGYEQHCRIVEQLEKRFFEAAAHRNEDVQGRSERSPACAQPSVGTRMRGLVADSTSGGSVYASGNPSAASWGQRRDGLFDLASLRCRV
jgi:hypothetical protein